MDQWIIYALLAINAVTFLVPIFLVLQIALAAWLLWRSSGG